MSDQTVARSGNSRVVVLDDDPTGTQAASGVTVLLGGGYGRLAEVLRHERSVYLQTNSRSLSESAAVELAHTIRTLIDEASAVLGVEIRVVLRGDSTLRGHVFTESRVFSTDDSVLVFVPAFPEVGRTTRDGIHSVRTGETTVPVGQTEFAADPVFSFSSSHLPDFVEERTGSPGQLVGLDGVHSGTLVNELRSVPGGTVLVVDAVTPDDVRLIARSIERVWHERQVVVRCAASLAAELAGVPSSTALELSTVARPGRALVVCGSHTELARTQLACLAEIIGPPTEIVTDEAIKDATAAGSAATAREMRTRRPGGVRFVTTQRDRSPQHASIDDGAMVMRALTEAARQLADPGGTIITKGGITAADVIEASIGATQARVLGQVRPGVSVWEMTSREGQTVLSVIVPGNMGDTTILAELVTAVTS